MPEIIELIDGRRMILQATLWRRRFFFIPDSVLGTYVTNSWSVRKEAWVCSHVFYWIFLRFSSLIQFLCVVLTVLALFRLEDHNDFRQYINQLGLVLVYIWCGLVDKSLECDKVQGSNPCHSKTFCIRKTRPRWAKWVPGMVIPWNALYIDNREILSKAYRDVK